MRISVQLVKVADGYHLWSETYDRTLDDIFAVQDDIAQSVVKELRTTLLGRGAGLQGERRGEGRGGRRGEGPRRAAPRRTGSTCRAGSHRPHERGGQREGHRVSAGRTGARSDSRAGLGRARRGPLPRRGLRLGADGGGPASSRAAPRSVPWSWLPISPRPTRRSVASGRPSTGTGRKPRPASGARCELAEQNADVLLNTGQLSQ